MLPLSDLDHVLEHTRSQMEKVRGKTIFLTGATGFFGKWMMETFLYANTSLKLGAHLLCLSRDPDSFLAKNAGYNTTDITFVKGDITNFQVPGTIIDFIIHAATDMSGYGEASAMRTVYESIVDGTIRILELAAQQKVLSVLHTSSGAVYGPQPAEMLRIPESYGGGPDLQSAAAAYGEGKRAAEMLAGFYQRQHGVPSKIARCFAFIGPYLPIDATFAAASFLRDALAGRDITINGDGTPERSYMYAADLAIWLWHILLEGKDCYPYNVGADEPVSMASLARLIAHQRHGQRIGVNVTRQPTGHSPQRYIPDTKRAREELNLDVYIRKEDAVSRTMNFYTSKY